MKEYREKYPWMVHYTGAKQRCTNPKHDSYQYYGGRGIKFLLTQEDCKKLWFECCAWRLQKPSIDRKDSNNDYTYKNCRFIELGKNVIKGNKNKTKPILQFDKNGNFIREWRTQKTAMSELKILTISACLRGKQHKAGGFKWKYK